MIGAFLGVLAIILISGIVGALAYIVWKFHPHPVTRWLPTLAGLIYYVMNFRIPAPAVIAIQNHTVYPIGDGLRVLSLAPAVGIGVVMIVRLFLRARAGKI
jgi:hypothetical protein